MIALPGGMLPSKYDEAEFLVGGRGVGKGEVDSVTFKVHEGYVAEADKWIKAKKFPYRTLTDLIRHALVRHVRIYLPSMEGEVEGSLLNELGQIDEVVAKWAFQNIFVKHIENIAEQVNATLQMPNGKHEVARMLHAIKRKIDATRNSFHKGVYQKMFMDRFASHLPQIALLDISKDEPADIGVELPVELTQELDGDDAE